jgi:hypothetical protein
VNKLYQSLYQEFGENETHKTRREITAKTGKQPSYIELLAELSLKQGYKPPPYNKSLNAELPTAANGDESEPSAQSIIKLSTLARQSG